VESKLIIITAAYTSNALLHTTLGVTRAAAWLRRLPAVLTAAWHHGGQRWCGGGSHKDGKKDGGG